MFKKALIDSKLWLGANIFGLSLYLLIEAQLLWPQPEINAPNSFDIIHFWTIYELPICLLSIVLNFIWMYLIIKSKKMRPSIYFFGIWLLVFLTWVIGVSIFGSIYTMIKIYLFTLQKGN